MENPTLTPTERRMHSIAALMRLRDQLEAARSLRTYYAGEVAEISTKLTQAQCQHDDAAIRAETCERQIDEILAAHAGGVGEVLV